MSNIKWTAEILKEIRDVERWTRSLRPDQRHHRFNLTIDEIADIGLLSLYWASFEFTTARYVAHLLEAPYGAAKYVIYNRDISSLAKIINSKKRNVDLDDYHKDLIDEFNYCLREFKHSRNTYAHGMIFTAEDGDRVAVTPSEAKSEILYLKRDLSRAMYSDQVALRLLAIFIGGSRTPLPARPL